MTAVIVQRAGRVDGERPGPAVLVKRVGLVSGPIAARAMLVIRPLLGDRS